jgi:predicted Zn-dependent peptidase
MRLLVWSNPGAAKVNIKIRVHSGAAFDPQGKEGVMQLLADILFPDASLKDFFKEELNGNLEVFCNYDYIQINASGDAEHFLRILETLSTALTNPPINKETTQRVRSALLLRVKELEQNPVYVADRAVAKRLFGTFPYGRPPLGSSESLSKIDFADLLFARERFLTADNATMAISGNVKADFAFRAVKRLFGSWLKSDKKVPPTFAQPETPKAELQILDSPVENSGELRFAMRGLSRNDKDFYALRILEEVLKNRLQTREGKKSFVEQKSNVLRGYVVFGISNWNVGEVKKTENQVSLPANFNSYQSLLLSEVIKPEEFEKARKAVLENFAKTDLQDYWLDIHTFQLTSAKEDAQRLQNVTVADVQRVLEKLRKEPVASVLVVSAEKTTENTSNSIQ